MHTPDEQTHSLSNPKAAMQLNLLTESALCFQNIHMSMWKQKWEDKSTEPLTTRQ